MLGNRSMGFRRLTAAQKALLTLHKIQARSLFLVVNGLLILLVIYTSNQFPRKFVRVQGDCDSNWLHVDAIEGSEAICCNNEIGGYEDAPCYTGMDLMPIVSSLQGAWTIPLTALVLNYGSMMLGPNVSMPRVRIYVRRGLLYVAVMAFRTVVLYIGLGLIEERMLHLTGRSSSCWYADLRHGKRCPANFDHSDHIVLLVSHYMAIPLFEWFAVNVESAGPSLKRTLLRAWLIILGGMATYLLVFTASYFHTTAENLLGLIIAQGGVMVPLALLSQDYFSTYKWLRLSNFVLPPEDYKKDY
ncbi:uncharacterized protein PHALS_10475 [Plasmopara halstedii]|uniref:Uncharacterized protein n=1 Tax=Plasmopara halstedii TaxID=4781 RepID=A0A0P1AGP8_PLAHL|nr:uncharacterized protein PHALS_10475 [Plasmopara halstedii]CEG40263.1 hypothetical protein PHALS_10475 [Plasmopara halstedii]|eukprot:XP_024576632.1 hypothetical protein PHALS_10475 [Plasmopara halstedii]